MTHHRRTRPVRGPRRGGHSYGPSGLTYLEVLVSLAIVCLVVVSLAMGLAYGSQLSQALEARTAVLNAAQAEMERLRGIPVGRLASYPIDTERIIGAVRIEELTARRKRVTVQLWHRAYPHQPLTLVTYMHQRGLNP